MLNYFIYIALALIAAHLYNKLKPRSRKDSTIMLIFGSGGHTTELLLMLESLDVNQYRKVHLIIAETDTWSLTKITDHFKSKMMHPIDLSQPHENVTIWRVKRAREVKQSYLTSVWTTLIALAHSCIIVAICRVDLIVTNGPGTAVPLVLANWLLSKVLGWRSKCLFIESFCRVDSLSLSGKILIPFADKFVVHWA